MNKQTRWPPAAGSATETPTRDDDAKPKTINSSVDEIGERYSQIPITARTTPSL